jgi:hypothetical protein
MFVEIVNAGTPAEFRYTTRKQIGGVKFGRWTPIMRFINGNTTRTDRHLWLCTCECGKSAFVHQTTLLSGASRSCGCYKRDVRTKHGRSGIVNGKRTDRTYAVWTSMIGRCYVTSAGGYERYGAKGVTVCNRWRHSFENFLADMGEVPEGKSIDRFPDRDGNYEPGNCRWATLKEQINNRRNTLEVEYEGRVVALADAARLSGIKYKCLSARYKKGLRGADLFHKGSYLGRNQYSA